MRFITALTLLILVGLLGYGFIQFAPLFSHTHASHSHNDDHHHSPPKIPWEAPTTQPDRIALNWSDDPATTLSVTWRTDTTVTGAVAQIAVATPAPRFDREAVDFSAETEILDLSAVDNEHIKALYHSVTFTELEPATLYAYRVGDGITWSEWYQTRTAHATPSPVKFIYFGDAQNGIHSHWSRNIRAAYTEASDAQFIIHAGDLVNRAHRNVEWGEWFVAGGWIHGMLPSIPVPGNHEYGRMGGDDSPRQLSMHWRPQFTLPENGPAGLEETAYFVDYQGVRIVGMNSNRSIDQQAPWLDQVLESNPHPWAILTFHHPVFSSSGTRDNPELRDLWKPIIDKHNVDLVLQGHDHTYARGRSNNVNAGLNTRDQASGTVYVNSVSGAKMYEIKEDRWDAYNATMERAAENTQLFQIVSIDGDTLDYRAYTVTGELYDAFKLVKAEGPNTFIAVDVPSAERTHENTIPYKRTE